MDTLNGGFTDGEPDLTFNTGTGPGNPTVSSLASQPDGKILVGGRFTTYDGISRYAIARIDQDGSLDTTFNFPSSAIGDVLTIAVQPDGKTLIGGTVTTSSGVRRIARLNSDGSLDATFDQGTGPNSQINTIVLLKDGKIMIGGGFTSYNGVNRRGIARLDPDGGLDTTFDPGTGIGGSGAIVSSVLVWPDGKIFIAGRFESFNGVGRSRVARLNTDGSLDTTFDPGSGVAGNSNVVHSAALQGDGKIIVGGQFDSYNGVQKGGFARINTDGGLDTTFVSGSGVDFGRIDAVKIQQDGKIVIGGNFSIYNGTARNRFVRINTDGSLDVNFEPVFGNDLAGGGAMVVDLLPDGQILIGGGFTTYNGVSRHGIARINADASLDAAFHPGAGPIGGTDVGAVAVQPDGKILISGGFTVFNGVGRNRIARVNSDGSLDTAFDPGIGLDVGNNAFAIQPDGKILIAGGFPSYNGIARKGIARLNEDGSLDTTFDSGLEINFTLGAIALQPDGKILIGGNFQDYGGIEINRIARLKSDGSLDTSFDPGSGASSFVTAIVIQPDGKIMIGGSFSSYNNVIKGRIARINSDGSLDTTFNTGPSANAGFNSIVEDISLQQDGKIFVAGEFTAYRGIDRSGIVRINVDGSIDASFDPGTGVSPVQFVQAMKLQADGKVILAGNFQSYNGVSRVGIARVNNDGSLDTTFDPGTGTGGSSFVNDFALQQDNKILLVGSFRTYDSVTVSGFVRILNSCCGSSNSTLFDYDGDGRSDLSVRRPANNVWYLQRGTAGYTAQEFGVAGDRMVPADYDGDGKTDVAVFRPSNGTWYVYMSQSQTFQTFGWGVDGDMPVPTDRDNDGKADLVIYRESNNTWYTRFANATFNQFEFGVAGDKPMLGDFDGDGIGDVALFRPSNNNWYLLKSSLGFFVQTWGQAGDIPLTGDFDGDGATDQAVFRPGTGQWFLSRTTAGFSSQTWGQNGDIPVAADYDGDGKTDVAVFRPSNGTWYFVNSTTGILILPFGQDGDIPTQAAFIN
ncbi:MAG: FG-GAP-like repeat-containing protein [Pyrinomonadaceae bacterium]